MEISKLIIQRMFSFVDHSTLLTCLNVENGIFKKCAQKQLDEIRTQKHIYKAYCNLGNNCTL